MKIVWDEPKRQRNIAVHHLDFDELDLNFFLDALIRPAKQGRLMAIGPLTQDIVTVVFARLGAEGISVISMRRASRKERLAYDKSA